LDNTFLNHNIYYSSSGTKNYVTWDTPYSSIGSWRTIAGENKETDSDFVDPKFTNPSSLDFHLQETSPAVDKGTDLSLSADFEGNSVPQGTLPISGHLKVHTLLVLLAVVVTQFPEKTIIMLMHRVYVIPVVIIIQSLRMILSTLGVQ